MYLPTWPLYCTIVFKGILHAICKRQREIITISIFQKRREEKGMSLYNIESYTYSVSLWILPIL